MKKIWCLMLVGFMAVVGCKGEDHTANAAPIEVKRITHVITQMTNPDTLVLYSNLPATAGAWREVALGFQEAGQVVAVYKNVGDVVVTGEAMVRLDTELLDAAFAEAEAGLKFQKYTYDGATQLFDEGSISKQDYYSAEYNFKKAEATYRTLKKRLAHAVLRAPFSGTLAMRHVELGQQVQVGFAAFDLVQTDRIRIKAWLPENEILGIQKGSGSDVTFDAYPGKTFSGQVGHVGPSATSSQRVFPLEVYLDNQTGAIRPGMIGKLKLVRQRLHDVVVIPRSAVVERETGTVAFVVQNGVAKKRDVHLGVAEGAWVVVEKGVGFGEQVVIQGGRELIEGDLVSAQEERIQ